MTDKNKIQDILEAINTLLNNAKEKPLNLTSEVEKPLELTNEVKNSQSKLEEIPKNTEKIILQAEKYLKK
tara:strand:+ start:195 stop:404 length:210 start_codon:yes stop_codon:yes gene_type:complete